ARDLRNGRPTNAFGRLFDLLVPGPSGKSPADPVSSTEARAILDKASERLWEAIVRYGVASADHDGHARRQPQTHAHGLAAAFAVFGARNRLVRRRGLGGGAALGRRRLRRGDLLSTSEVAALAHLPLDRVVPALARAGARPVAPPPTICREPLAGRVLG